MHKNKELLQSLEGQHTKARALRLLPGAARANRRKVVDESDLDMFAVVRILLKRRVWIYACTGAMLAAAALVCFTMTPRYRAVTQLQLLKQGLSGLSVGDASGSSGGGFTDALDFNLTLQTQATALKSDTLALQVIKELSLADTKEFRYDPLIKTASVRSQMSVPLDQSPVKLATVVNRFKANLGVEAVSGTRLIQVSYTHPDPQMAANIVNHLLQDFVEHNFQERYKATNKATDWLSQQLVELKTEVERSQERAVQLQKESGIFGPDEHHNIVITRLEQLNNDVTSAESNRVVKEGIYQLASSGKPELIAGLLGSSSGGSEAMNSLALINSLRQQESDLSAQVADAASKYGPEYPRLIQMNERLTSLRSSIQAALSKVVGRAQSEYQLAASREAAAKKTFAEQKRIASEMNSRAIDYTIAKNEAESNRVLYESLSKKLKEAGVLAGLRSSELNVIDPAVVPDHPAKPNIPLYLGFGALAGIALGVVCAFVADALDGTIYDPDQVETKTAVPVLGVIPQAELGKGKCNALLEAQAWNRLNGTAKPATPSRLLSRQNYAVAEAFRALRTSILLSSGAPTRVSMITSGAPQEGKSFAAVNLAAAMAQFGGKVLLVDADLRRGTLSRVLNQYSGIGLSHVLQGSAEPDAYRRIDNVPGLTLMPAGVRPECPSELLGSDTMTELIRIWRREFSFVLIDTPPVLAVTDALLLAPHVDGIVVVARFGVTNQQAIVRTIKMLTDVRPGAVGVLVNGMDLRSPDYYHYAGSYGYGAYDFESTSQTTRTASPKIAKGEIA